MCKQSTMCVSYGIDNQTHKCAIPVAIMQQLTQADGLIDRFVFRLYGLSEEEIAVVEGNR